jgi:hypothetical protein
MLETHDSSRKPLTVEQLLQLKRIERPTPEFWLTFERELQEKQLKALVKPTRAQRVRRFLFPKLAVLAPLSAAAGFAAVGLFSHAFQTQGIVSETLLASPEVNTEFFAYEDLTEEGAEVAEFSTPTAPRRTDAHFVVDALVPEMASPKPFRTVALPETFLASRDGSAYYVVNAFTAGAPGNLSIPDAALEF